MEPGETGCKDLPNVEISCGMLHEEKRYIQVKSNADIVNLVSQVSPWKG